MSSVEERTATFYAWEIEGRGRRTHIRRVVLEPPFRPFPGHQTTAGNRIDDARKPTWLSSLVDRQQPPRSTPLAPQTGPDPDPFEWSEAVVECEILVPVEEKIEFAASAAWLRSLAASGGHLAFEMIGSGNTVSLRLCGSSRDVERARAHAAGFFPRVVFRHPAAALPTLWTAATAENIGCTEFVLAREFMLPLDEPDSKRDPFAALVAVLGRVGIGEVAVVQVLFAPTTAPWGGHALAAVTTPYGEPFFTDAPEITKLTTEKCVEPLFATALRCIVRTHSREAAEDVLVGVRDAIATVGSLGRNELHAIRAPDFDGLLGDVLARSTRRSGMILSLSDLEWLVHLPTPAVKSDALLRPSTRTKSAPATHIDKPFVLGSNEHDGQIRRVGLSIDERLRHCYLIGASGVGKSSLLLSMIEQDIAAGHGFGVLDPHGDLVDDVVARIPESRAADVLLLDPADEEYPVGFNILSAHSELERTLLASDLVAVFRRFSTSFGDQMATVLGNAILAFLESPEGGTLLDLRRFLIDKSFRAEFLEKVTDLEVRGYWQQEFPLLKGLPYAPILTRLNAFFRPKVLRYMVAQKRDRFDVRSLMDGRQILLARLSQGAIGEENSYMLGSLLMAKLAQAAMSRQDERAERRVPFFLYADEFHHFVTPSVAAILSGARKYGLGLTLAHQETRQLKSRSEDVASAVLSNAYTRVVFRVGEQDAKALADGFSFFEATDLQNLGVGEAITRIERRDFDFNLAAARPSAVDDRFAKTRRDAARAASRATYATARTEVEATLETLRRETESAEPVERPLRTKRKPPAAAPLTPESLSPPPLPGRGGPQHKYLQSLVRKLAEDRGFEVHTEKAVLGGHGHIDVALTRGDLRVACEISVTTRVEHEVDNLSKCLSAGFDVAVLVSWDSRALEHARTLLGATDSARARLCTPDELLTVLSELRDSPGTAPTVPHRTDSRKSPSAGAGDSTKAMLIAKDAAAYIGVAQQTLAKMRWAGDSPPYFKVGRLVLYDRTELDTWLALRRRQSTSDPGPENA